MLSATAQSPPYRSARSGRFSGHGRGLLLGLNRKQVSGTLIVRFWPRSGH